MVFSIVTIIAGVHENQRGHHKMMILNSLLFDSLLKSCVFLGVVGASHHSELLLERSPSVTIPIGEQRVASSEQRLAARRDCVHVASGLQKHLQRLKTQK